MKLNNRGSWTLISLLVVVVIIVVAFVLLFGKNSPLSGGSTVKQGSPLLDPHSQKKTVIGKSIDTGKASACLQQLVQIRQGIEAWKAMQAKEGNPPALKDLDLSVGPEFFQCPVSKQPYTYDPATGKVHCPTHPNY